MENHMKHKHEAKFRDCQSLETYLKSQRVEWSASATYAVRRILVLLFQAQHGYTLQGTKDFVFPRWFLDRTFLGITSNSNAMKAFGDYYHSTVELPPALFGALRVATDEYEPTINRSEGDPFKKAEQFSTLLGLPRYRRIYDEGGGEILSIPEYPQWLINTMDWIGVRKKNS
jgi:hypothetical protein